MQLQANPVLKRLTHDRKWHHDPRAMQLLAATALIGGVIALTALIADPMRTSPLKAVPITFVIAGIILALIHPLIVFALTTVITVHESRREDFQQLRLAGIDPKEIASAYLEAAVQRQRYGWALSVGFTPGAALALTHLLVAAGVNPACIGQVACQQAFTLEAVLFGMGISLIGVGAVIGMTMPLYPLALRGGAWIGMRWPDRAALITGGVVIAYLALIGTLASLLITTPALALVYVVGALLGVPVTSRVITAMLGDKLDEAVAMRSMVKESG